MLEGFYICHIFFLLKMISSENIILFYPFRWGTSTFNFFVNITLIGSCTLLIMQNSYVGGMLLYFIRSLLLLYSPFYVCFINTCVLQSSTQVTLLSGLEEYNQENCYGLNYILCPLVGGCSYNATADWRRIRMTGKFVTSQVFSHDKSIKLWNII